MPEYLAPGVYVEETSFRSKSIEGVSTTTTGFVGPTRFGPIDIPPDVLTSLSDFERVYGDGQQLSFSSGKMDNYVWHAARAFFENGGQRLYVVRIFQPRAGDDGRASYILTGNGSTTRPLAVRARFPGEAGKVSVRITLQAGQNVLGGTEANKTIGALQPFDTVWISDVTSPIGPAGAGRAYQALMDLDPLTQRARWKFVRGSETLFLSDLHPNLDPRFSDQIRVDDHDRRCLAGRSHGAAAGLERSSARPGACPAGGTRFGAGLLQRQSGERRPGRVVAHRHGSLHSRHHAHARRAGCPGRARRYIGCALRPQFARRPGPAYLHRCGSLPPSHTRQR